MSVVPRPVYQWLPGRGKLRQCGCGRLYWTGWGYRGHYVLRHVWFGDTP